jgi:hypothetical protein
LRHQAYLSSVHIDRLVAWASTNDGTEDVIDPLDIRDQTQSCNDVQVEEEAVLVLRIDEAIDEDLNREQNERDYKYGVEVRISILISEPGPHVVLHTR